MGSWVLLGEKQDHSVTESELVDAREHLHRVGLFLGSDSVRTVHVTVGLRSLGICVAGGMCDLTLGSWSLGLVD